MAKTTQAIVMLLLAGCAHRAAAPAAVPKPPYTVLTAEDISQSPGQSLEQLLLAHVPGLTIERSMDGQVGLRLRGPTSIMHDEGPLFVLNGVALGPAVTGNLSAVDIHDIETVQVLREAAATAAYGIRGAGGVIVIRTKSN